MVLSLAFILAFIGASVALVIGILIFSEVTEAMALTLPELLVTIPTTPENDGIWFGIEHCDRVNCDLDTDENRIFFASGSSGNPITPFTSQMKFGSGAGFSTSGYLARTFDIEEIDGKELKFEISQDFSGMSSSQLQVWDGEFDPNPTGACGIDCFPLNSGLVTSGSGGILTLFTWSIGVQPITIHSVTPNLASFDSPTGKVTVVVKMRDTSGTSFASVSTYSIEIEDIGTYYFKADPTDPTWNGATHTVVRGSQGNPNPSTMSLFTSNPPPAIPVINSPDTINANETFNNALNIGFTVLGVLPVALFFFLFAIFGGRLGE